MAKATKLPSGKRRCKAYYTDEYGNYKSKSFTAEKKKDVEGAAALFLMERRHASRPENKTMGELIDRYIDSQSNLLSPSTIVGYRKIRRTAFQDIVDVRIGLLTKEKYQKAINEYSKGRAPKTVFGTLDEMYSFCALDEPPAIDEEELKQYYEKYYIVKHTF